LRFDLDVNGRVRSVSIQSDGQAARDALRVDVDGQSAIVGVRPTELGVTLTFDDGRVVDVAVTELGQARWLIELPYTTVSVSVDGRRRSSAAGGSGGAGEQRVVAPMPGRVVRVLVKQGEDVAAGQGLVVVEAMKMENELTSPKAGTVKTVEVVEGAAIESGKLLVVVE
jgi:acetyl/propionyl-CoA carboxylase alpha subunit